MPATKAERREITQKAFMLGVDWTLKIITQHSDIWNFDNEDAQILRRKAEKVVQILAGKPQTNGAADDRDSTAPSE